MARIVTLVLLVLGIVASPSSAYIAVDARRLTLSEVMLEFPTVLLVEVDKADERDAAFVLKVVKPIQGKAPQGNLKLSLKDKGKLPERLSFLKVKSQLVIFLGSPDQRSLIMAENQWFITRPNQGWERFQQFRDDFQQLFVGSTAELAEACSVLCRGGKVVVATRTTDLPEKEYFYVEYDFDFPHRRNPALKPNRVPMKNPETQLIHKSAAVRQQAAMELAVTPRFYSDLLKLFEDPHPEVRLAAIAAIHSMTKATIPTASLVKLLNDEDRFVCSFAARAMARDQVYGKAYVDRLEKCLDDRNPDYDFRPHRGAEAAEAILKLDPNGQAAKKALQFFLSEKMLKDQRIDSEGTRTAAARALARCGTAAAGALPELRKRLTDPVPATRIAAAEALLSISTKKEDEVDARRLIEKALRSPSIPEVIQAMRVVRDSKLPLDLLEPLKKSSEGVIQAELKLITAR